MNEAWPSSKCVGQLGAGSKVIVRSKVNVLTKFYTHDAEGPNISPAIVLTLVHGQDNFRGHPIRCSNKGVCRAV